MVDPQSEDRLAAHLQEWADEGWDLVTVNQRLVHGQKSYTKADVYTEYYFYWRKP